MHNILFIMENHYTKAELYQIVNKKDNRTFAHILAEKGYITYDKDLLSLTTKSRISVQELIKNYVYNPNCDTNYDLGKEICFNLCNQEIYSKKYIA
ncbi:hypothetical protein DEFDS_P181 (plasmid) [Deferribacter desulfuricans SSM1]|uniref:Uncharacterized protein n=1 Tax=Deferribacter desulfuricans (strain DSM 14783 / JCM 11476 / NBRC 101012 / SSM1) TaxID=639282 RepID=D3PF09_DEFDS|nr:hypothetical protein [Deferribacter desulfuricans]BAI81801.1 hypothetical protein DEFDS_P181 [Deferribacter desulfuricans SSM1]